jgi:hypothetical protein
MRGNPLKYMENPQKQDFLGRQIRKIKDRGN